MKRYIYILFITMILLVGCKENTQNSATQTTTKASKQTTKLENTTKNITTEETTPNTPEPTEAAIAIREVLKNERPFIDVNNGHKETYKNDLHYFLENNNANIGWGNFIMLDMENNVNRQVWITIRNLKYNEGHLDLNDTTSLIFRYYNGKVYGYQCNKIVSLDTSEYFLWNSENLYLDNDVEYQGGGKIEFEGEKIKFIYYIWAGDMEAKEWLQNYIQDENVEIIEDSEMCNFITQKSKEKYIYDVGNGNVVEDIDAYIY